MFLHRYKSRWTGQSLLTLSCILITCPRQNAELVTKGVISTTVAEVRLRKGESIDRAIKRLKKKLDKEGIMREIRMHRHYEKPSERRRRKAARARARARGRD